MLGQLFLFTCMLAAAGIAGILFILFGPVPVKRKVTIVPRLSAFVPTPVAAPSLVAQLAPARDQFFTPPQAIQSVPPAVHAVAPAPAPVVSKPRGGKVQPLPRKRAAKGTAAPFAPVVRHRPMIREEDVATSPVQLFDQEEFTTVDDPVTVPAGRSMRHR